MDYNLVSYREREVRSGLGLKFMCISFLYIKRLKKVCYCLFYFLKYPQYVILWIKKNQGIKVIMKIIINPTTKILSLFKVR